MQLRRSNRLRLAAIIPLLMASCVSAAGAAQSDSKQCAYLTAPEAGTLLGSKLTKTPEMYAAGTDDAFCGYEAGSESVRVYVRRHSDAADWRALHGADDKTVSGVGDHGTWALLKVPGGNWTKATFTGLKGANSLVVMINRAGKPATFEQSRPILQKIFSRIH